MEKKLLVQIQQFWNKFGSYVVNKLIKNTYTLRSFVDFQSTVIQLTQKHGLWQMLTANTNQ